MSQNARTTDLRVRRTRKLLRDALVDLIEEQGFAALKVSDIADHAGINRATFYRHYYDKYDLLAHCMDDALEDLKSQTHPPLAASGEMNHTALGTNLVTMLVHVAENAAFYRVMLGKDGVGTFVSRLRDYLRQVAAERWQILATSNVSQPVMPTEVVLNFIASAYIGVIVWWVDHRCPGTPTEMADHLLVLTIEGPCGALGIHPPELA